ncbi:hypothetical protein ASF66_16430 [Pseudomonas sp. Leaf129]|nr:hypothetical protein ASF66_16430 [Pseudomonas sp. Leaf129]
MTLLETDTVLLRVTFRAERALLVRRLPSILAWDCVRCTAKVELEFAAAPFMITVESPLTMPWVIPPDSTVNTAPSLSFQLSTGAPRPTVAVSPFSSLAMDVGPVTMAKAMAHVRRDKLETVIA